MPWRALPVLLPTALAASAQAVPGPRSLAPLIGIPYVDDAVTDARGRTVTFRAPDRALPSRGLNCSGFVVEAARRLWGYAGSPREAARDRAGDSGPEAESGEDWDFGYDLVLNLSEGLERRWLSAQGPRPADAPARSLQGWPARDRNGWRRALADLPPAQPGLVAFSRTEADGRVRFHHVAVVLRDGRGRIGFWQTLPHGSVHRLDLASDAGFARLGSMFGPTVRVLVLEATPR